MNGWKKLFGKRNGNHNSALVESNLEKLGKYQLHFYNSLDSNDAHKNFIFDSQSLVLSDSHNSTTTSSVLLKAESITGEEQNQPNFVSVQLDAFLQWVSRQSFSSSKCLFLSNLD